MYVNILLVLDLSLIIAINYVTLNRLLLGTVAAITAHQVIILCKMPKTLITGGTESATKLYSNRIPGITLPTSLTKHPSILIITAIGMLQQ